MIIPNAVGRIDEITDAIREGNKGEVYRLLASERDRIDQKVSLIKSELDKAISQRDSVVKFAAALISGPEAWNQARRDCGWKGEE